MDPINGKQLKRAWKRDVQYGNFTGSYRQWLDREARRAELDLLGDHLPTTYADAAALLLQKK